MKKLFIGVVAALCCFALAAPAVAEVKVGGMITFDMMYTDVSGETARGGFVKAPNAINGDNGINQTTFGVPHSWTRLNVKYDSDDKKIGGFMELRMGGGRAATTNIYLNYAWIDWHFTKDFYLRIGRQTMAFAIMYPDLWIGQPYSDTAGVTFPILGMGYGNIHGGSARDAIRAYWKINDNVRVEFQLMDPDSSDAALEGIRAVPQNGGVNGETVREENVIPRIDLAVPIKIANFAIEPSFSWLKCEVDQQTAGFDDGFDIWGIALGVKAGFGPFTFSGEVTYGQNLANGNYAGGSPFAAGRYVDQNRDGLTDTFEDTDVWAFWVDLAFNFGPATIHGVVGMEDTSNDGASIANDEREVTRWMYGLSLPITVGKGFIVRPEFVYYDNDSGALNGVNNPTQVDYGDQWVLGVQFNLTF